MARIVQCAFCQWLTFVWFYWSQRKTALPFIGEESWMCRVFFEDYRMYKPTRQVKILNLPDPWYGLVSLLLIRYVRTNKPMNCPESPESTPKSLQSKQACRWLPDPWCQHSQTKRKIIIRVICIWKKRGKERPNPPPPHPTMLNNERRWWEKWAFVWLCVCMRVRVHVSVRVWITSMKLLWQFLLYSPLTTSRRSRGLGGNARNLGRQFGFGCRLLLNSHLGSIS